MVSETDFNLDAELYDWWIEAGSAHLFVHGAIYNDSKGRFEDGQRVRTSIVRELRAGQLTTLNTKYLLVNADAPVPA